MDIFINMRFILVYNIQIQVYMWAHALLASFHACNFWLKMKNHIKKKKEKKKLILILNLQNLYHLHIGFEVRFYIQGSTLNNCVVCVRYI